MHFQDPCVRIETHRAEDAATLGTRKEEDKARYLNLKRTVKGASKDWPQSLTIRDDLSSAVDKDIISTQESSHQSAS